jgi:hypothetical protein
MEQTPQPAEFEKKKTAYFSRFALRHLSDMKILRKGGVLGKENRDWRNIGEHTISEAVNADILAEALDANRANVVRAANLHDWYKRREVETMEQFGGTKGYQITSEEDERLLRGCGVPEDLIKLAHSNIPGSADPKYLANRTLEEKIVHYVDMVLHGTALMSSFEERLAPQLKNPRAVEFSESFRDHYGGISLWEVEKLAVEQEQKEFEELLGLPEGGLIPFLRKKLEERINASE